MINLKEGETRLQAFKASTGEQNLSSGQHGLIKTTAKQTLGKSKVPIYQDEMLTYIDINSLKGNEKWFGSVVQWLLTMQSSGLE